MLTAHVKGRKHREALVHIREPKASNKRKVAEIADFANQQSELKKSKNDEVDAEPIENGERFEPKTPWQVERQINKEEKTQLPNRTKLIEELPKGFFDDEKLDNRVRDTVEKQTEINSELDRFYKEVEELETQKEEELYEKFEVSAIRNDIELIDEQIERWKAVNELEKQKEAVVHVAKTKFDQEPNFDPIEDEDLDADFDFDNVNWRTKTF